MVSSLLRRSGVAVCLILELIRWRPRLVIQVGVGQNHKELDVMRETWGNGPDWHLDGYEPHPDVFRAIQPHYPGRLHCVAISDHVGEATLYSRLRHKDGSSLWPIVGDDVRQHVVPLNTLDRLYYSGVPEETLVWIDCEGAEEAVIKGGHATLSRALAVNVEMTSRPNHCGESNTVIVDRALRELGYLRQWVHTSRVSAGQSDCLYLKSSLFVPELCCCPCAITEANERGDACRTSNT